MSREAALIDMLTQGWRPGLRSDAGSRLDNIPLRPGLLSYGV